MILAVVWLTSGLPTRRARFGSPLPSEVSGRTVRWARASCPRRDRQARHDARAPGPPDGPDPRRRPTPTPPPSSTSPTPFECLVVTVISAQTTDRRVNAASPALFAAYPTPEAMAAAPREHMEQLLGPLGFFRAKTDSLLKLSQALVERHDGVVPGPPRRPRHAARASAARPPTSCWATRSASPGITVDTHFGRLARRFGWTEETDPVKVEHAVGALFPKRDWTMLSHHLIWHGRRRCHAKKPACGACPLAKLCPSYGAGPTDPIEAEKLVTTRAPHEEGVLAAAPGRSLSAPSLRRAAPTAADRRTPSRRQGGHPRAARGQGRIGMLTASPAPAIPSTADCPR